MNNLMRAAILCLLCWSAASHAATDPASCPPPAQELSTLFETGAAQARDRGMLWRITKNGHDSFLYGTLHVGKASWLPPGPRIKNALKAADVIALELDPMDASVQREIQAALAGSSPSAVAPQLQRALDKLAAEGCLPAGSLSGMRPELQVMMLGILVGRRDGLDAAYGAEMALALIGRAAGLPVVSLEQAASQIKAMLGQTPAETESMVREGLDDLQTGRAHRMLVKTAQVWESADTQALERYANWCECMRTPSERALMKRMLEDRNPGLAAGIDALHSQGKNVFAAVGALHMVGPGGLVELLSAKGFRIAKIR